MKCEECGDSFDSKGKYTICLSCFLFAEGICQRATQRDAFYESLDPDPPLPRDQERDNFPPQEAE